VSGLPNPLLYGVPARPAEVKKRLALASDWRLPTATEQAAFKAHRHLSGLADALIAAADVDGESWILLERDWAGYPDPPRFAFLAYRPDGSTICEADLDDPSPLWRLPAGVPFQFSKEV